MKRHHSILLSIAFFAAAAALPISTTTGANRDANEDASCMLSSASGAYGFVESGTIIGLGPYASAGTVISDGEGG